jgi:nitrite reductase (NADH) large subunit
VTGGAASVEALGRCTGAGTVCGSCKPLLANLLGATAAAVPVRRALLALSGIAALVAVLAVFLAVPYRESAAAALHWDVVWRETLLKQTSGFTLLGVALVASLVSLRKRIARFAFARFTSWQVMHVALGVVGCIALGVHTGFRFGANLNFWLMACFTGLLFAGGVGGAALALAPRLAPGTARALRTSALWLHVLLLWPLPALLGFHVLKSYYF